MVLLVLFIQKFVKLLKTSKTIGLSSIFMRLYFEIKMLHRKSGANILFVVFAICCR